MKFIFEYSEFSNWNPVLNKEVSDFIDQNKHNLIDLWDNEKSEEENMKFLTDYFSEFPELMKSGFNLKKITTVARRSGIKNMAPVLQNIGGVRDFRSF